MAENGHSVEVTTDLYLSKGTIPHTFKSHLTKPTHGRKYFQVVLFAALPQVTIQSFCQETPNRCTYSNGTKNNNRLF